MEALGPELSSFANENLPLGMDEFLARFSEPFLVSEDLPGEGTRGAEPVVVPLEGRRGGDVVTVGRDASSDLRLDSELVSNKHAYFVRGEDGAWSLADAGSTNGTFVDGSKLEPHDRHHLEDSEALRFGPSLRFRFFNPPALWRYMSYRSRMKP